MLIYEYYIEELFQNRKSECTIKNYIDSLNCFCRYAFKKDFEKFDSDKDIINIAILDKFNKYMQDPKAKKQAFSSNTIKLRLNALKSLIDFMGDNSLIKNYKNLIEYINKLIELTPPDFKNKEILTEDELKILFQKVDEIGGKNKNRRKLMIFCLSQLGMRRAEVSNLKVSDIHLSERKILIFGKGSKFRINTLNDKFIEIFNDYLIEREYYKNKGEYLFCSTRTPKLTEDGIYKDLESIYKKTGLKKNLHPHMLRRSYASILYKKGTPIFVIQKLLGHSSDITTRLYLEIDEEDMRNANNLFDIF